MATDNLCLTLDITLLILQNPHDTYDIYLYTIMHFLYTYIYRYMKRYCYEIMNLISIPIPAHFSINIFFLLIQHENSFHQNRNSALEFLFFFYDSDANDFL